VVDAQRGRAVAVQGMETHQVTIGGLVQRVVGEQPLGVGDGGGIGAPLLVEQYKLFQRSHELLRQLLARRQDPVVVTVGEEITGVGCHGGFQRGDSGRAGTRRRGRQRGLELGDIQGAGCTAAPGEGVLVHLQAGVHVGDALSERVQQLAQVGLRLPI